MEDTYLHKGLRKKLIAELEKKGIPELILQAFWEVPRHLFLDSVLYHKAYEDTAYPIASGQTISQPYTVAFQTHLLDVRPREKILEVGTGSAFQTMILAALKANVYTIERHKILFEKAQNHPLNKKFSNIQYFYGDGFRGLPYVAAFDKILITAGVTEIPQTLLRQLKVGGLMVVPVGTKDTQKMLRITKEETDEKIEEFGIFSFVPMLPGMRSFS